MRLTNAPVVFHGAVVDRVAALHLGVEVALVERADGDLAAAHDPFGPLAPHGAHVLGIEEPPAIEVLGLCQAARFQQPGVIGRIVVVHDPRRRVEAFDQQAAGVVGGIVDRTEDRRPAAVAQPFRGGFDQPLGHFRVVGRFEHAEAARVALVLGVIAGVVAHEDASLGHAVAVGDEFLGGPVQIEGMLAGIEELFLVQQQLRHPLRIFGINRPRHLEEGVEVAAGDDRPDLQPPFDRGPPPVCRWAATCGRIEVEVVDAIGLGDLGPALGQGAAGEAVRFQHPGELGLLHAPLDRLGHDAVHEHQPQPLHLVLGQHVGRDQADLLDLRACCARDG